MTANMLLLTATNLRMIVTALIMELVAKQRHPERHPGRFDISNSRQIVSRYKKLIYQTVDKLLAVTKSWPLQAVTLSAAPKLYGQP